MFEHFFDANSPFAGLVKCHWPMPLHGLAATGPFRENELLLWKVHVLRLFVSNVCIAVRGGDEDVIWPLLCNLLVELVVISSHSAFVRAVVGAYGIDRFCCAPERGR
jgi:hypothetical protein